MTSAKPKKRQIAMRVELDEGDNDFHKLRRFLKCLLRSYGIKCLSIQPPEKTVTFASATTLNADANKTDEPKRNDFKND
jgi:hypothetical protein